MKRSSSDGQRACVEARLPARRPKARRSPFVRTEDSTLGCFPGNGNAVQAAPVKTKGCALKWDLQGCSSSNQDLFCLRDIPLYVQKGAWVLRARKKSGR